MDSINHIIPIMMGLLFMGIGVWAVCNVAFALPWFMNQPQVLSCIARLGYSGARIFYIVLGAGLVGLGIMCIFPPTAIGIQVGRILQQIAPRNH